MSDSQSYLKLLKWLMQKDSLKQDSFLIGSPAGILRRTLAMSYAELTQREVEYLCLTRDTTEADSKIILNNSTTKYEILKKNYLLTCYSKTKKRNSFIVSFVA